MRTKQEDLMKKLLEEKIRDTISGDDIAYHVKDDVACRLALNTCVCLADEETFRLPFSDLLFPRVWSHSIDLAFLESHPDPEGVKHHRAQEYNSFQRR